MSDTPPPQDAEQHPEPNRDSSPSNSDTKPVKKPGIIRWWGLGVVGIASAVVAGVGPLILNPIAANAVNQAIINRGLQPSEGTNVSVNLLGAGVEITNADLSQDDPDGTARSIFASPRTAFDVALFESWLARDLVIEELTAIDVSGSLRRFSDGSLPLEPQAPTEDLPDTPSEPPAQAEQEEQDLLALWERWKPWLEKAWEHRPRPDGDSSGGAVPQPSPEHPKGIRYYPVSNNGVSERWWPRVVLRELAINTGDIALPIAEGRATTSPFDITQLTCEGSNVTTWLEAGEEMALVVNLTTHSAGTASGQLQRSPGVGSLQFSWDAIPLAQVAEPDIGGVELASWGPSGQLAWKVDLRWAGEALEGELVARLVDLRLKPSPGASAEVKQAAAALEQLHAAWAQLDTELQRIDPNTSPLGPLDLTISATIAGSPWAPVVSGLGTDGLITSIAAQREAITQRLRDAATAAAARLASDTKDAAQEALTTEAENTLNRLRDGDNPEEAARDAVDSLRDQGGDGLDALRNRLPNW